MKPIEGCYQQKETAKKCAKSCTAFVAGGCMPLGAENREYTKKDRGDQYSMDSLSILYSLHTIKVKLSAGLKF